MSDAKGFLELVGFVLLIAAAYTVTLGLALLTAGAGLILTANAPEASRSRGAGRRTSLRESIDV